MKVTDTGQSKNMRVYTIQQIKIFFLNIKTRSVFKLVCSRYVRTEGVFFAFVFF